MLEHQHSMEAVEPSAGLGVDKMPIKKKNWKIPNCKWRKSLYFPEDVRPTWPRG